MKYPEIAIEIKRMAEADQAMRKRSLENKGLILSAEDDKLDVMHTNRMIEIVSEIGWPNKTKVGFEAAQWAWLLVQHADHDVAFQKKCLELMKSEPKDEIDQKHVAYLEDRVRVNEGRLQLYGTQFFGESENYGPRPIEDAENVNTRRLALGMSTIEAYKQELIKHYFKK